jgi:hypothetical protein
MTAAECIAKIKAEILRAATIAQIARLRQPVRPCRYRQPQKTVTIAIDPTYKPDVSAIIAALNLGGIKAEVIR